MKFEKSFKFSEIIWRGCEIKTKVHNTSKKLPLHLSAKLSARYKRNVVTGEFHWAKRTADDFNFEVKRITKKFLSAGCHRYFIRSNENEKFTKI